MPQTRVIDSKFKARLFWLSKCIASAGRPVEFASMGRGAATSYIVAWL